MRASGTVNVLMMINILTIILIEVPCAYWFSSLWGLTAFGRLTHFLCLLMHITSLLLSVRLEENQDQSPYLKISLILNKKPFSKNGFLCLTYIIFVAIAARR